METKPGCLLGPQPGPEGFGRLGEETRDGTCSQPWGQQGMVQTPRQEGQVGLGLQGLDRLWELTDDVSAVSKLSCNRNFKKRGERKRGRGREGGEEEERGKEVGKGRRGRGRERGTVTGWGSRMESQRPLQGSLQLAGCGQGSALGRLWVLGCLPYPTPPKPPCELSGQGSRGHCPPLWACLPAGGTHIICLWD